MYVDSNDVKMYIRNRIMRKYHTNPKEGTFHKAGCRLQKCQCCGCLSMLPFLLATVSVCNNLISSLLAILD